MEVKEGDHQSKKQSQNNKKILSFCRFLYHRWKILVTQGHGCDRGESGCTISFIQMIGRRIPDGSAIGHLRRAGDRHRVRAGVSIPDAAGNLRRRPKVGAGIASRGGHQTEQPGCASPGLNAGAIFRHSVRGTVYFGCLRLRPADCGCRLLRGEAPFILTFSSPLIKLLGTLPKTPSREVNLGAERLQDRGCDSASPSTH